jgi:acyl-coenzyme A thioesterase PaaI-like protein
MTAAGDTNELVEMMNGAMESTIPPAHKMGVRIVEARRGYAAATVPAEGNGNHFGVVYAGVQFTVAEILGGVITLSTFHSAKYFPLVKNVDIKFVGMARSELRAEASLDDETIARVESEAAQRGKADFTLEAVVTDGDGHSVATTPEGCTSYVLSAARGAAVRGINSARTTATMSSAGTSPIR